MAAIEAAAIGHILTHNAPTQHDFTAFGTLNELWAGHAVDDVDAGFCPAAWAIVGANRLFSCWVTMLDISVRRSIWHCHDKSGRMRARGIAEPSMRWLDPRASQPSVYNGQAPQGQLMSQCCGLIETLPAMLRR